jgi:hypothetical protein
MRKLSRILQFFLAGVVATLNRKNDSTEQVKPPSELVNGPGWIITIILVNALLCELIVRCTWAKRKGWSNKFDIQSTSIFDRIFGSESFKDWFIKNCRFNVTPTFYEEYVYYRNYYKVESWLFKVEGLSVISDGLESTAEITKRNYLISKLSGLSENI